MNANLIEKRSVFQSSNFDLYDDFFDLCFRAQIGLLKVEKNSRPSEMREKMKEDYLKK